jgi:hypothetical protein
MYKSLTINNLVWIDGFAALASGCFTLLFKSKLSPIFNLPESLLTTLMVISFCYAIYSLSLARRASKPILFLKILVIGNTFYSVICAILTVIFYEKATFLGVGYLMLESAFVAALAFLEAQQIKKGTPQYKP